MKHIGELDKYLEELRALLNAIEATNVNYRILRYLKDLRSVAKKAEHHLKEIGYTD